MIEKDNIRDLFSRTLENHTTPVRPEVWSGLQAKMAVAGVSSVTVVKGISSLAKWLIGGAAVSIATVTTVVLVNQQELSVSSVKQKQEPKTSSVVKQETVSGVETHENTIDWNHVNGAHIASVQPADEPGTANPINYFSAGEVSAPSNVASSIQHVEHQELPTAQNPTTTNPVEQGHNPSVHSVDNPSAGAMQEASESKITKIPNFFSPNYDGENDYFFIESKNLNDFSVCFFDAKGNSVWKSDDPNFKWDGNSMSGEPVQPGTYSCMILARDSGGKIIKEYKIIEIRR